MDYKEILQILDENLPPTFRRKDVRKLTGGIITEGLLRAIPRGLPRPQYTRLGKFVVYEKTKFLTWAEEYYGQFAEYNTPGFFGRKVRRVTGAEGETGGGGERD